MGNVLVNDAYLYGIADALREKHNTEKKYLPSEMEDAVKAIDSNISYNQEFEDVKQILRNSNSGDWVDAICPYELKTEKERAEYIMQLAECGRMLSPNAHAITTPGWGEYRDITLADGTTMQQTIGRDPVFVLPPMNMVGRVTIEIPIGDISANSNRIIDFSNAVFSSNKDTLAIRTTFGRIISVTFSDCQRLSTATLSGAADAGTIFTHGIRFGKKVFEANSNWLGTIYGTWSVDSVPVFVPEGFEGTVYLSKLPLSVEIMVGIFNNLADMSGTDTTYTLNLGSENLAKLTTEQLDIAQAKGWELT